jgi:hypothetical protein
MIACAAPEMREGPEREEELPAYDRAQREVNEALAENRVAEERCPDSGR